jgi:hypothetical protein
MEFRLIVDDPDNAEPGKTIQVNDREWYLSKSLHVDLAHPELPNFTCISYVWGQAREPNPFHPGELMSSNTSPALSSAMTHSAGPAFWIDALCVPPTVPVKHHTLGSMGYIYSAAAEVIITTSASFLPVLNEMNDSDRLSEDVLLSLEEDDWVRSVWTYQEVVNAKAVYFVGGSFKIDGNHFLNCLGYSLTLYRAAHNISALDLSKQLPKLNALEELLVDWMLGGYTERSALRAMSQFRCRYNHDPRNYFYSVVGTMVRGPWPWNIEMAIEELAEEFMDVCEQKNDYSFIYTSNPRNRIDPKGRYWRPAAGLLQVVLTWHSWGEGQRGRHDEEGFWLQKMIPLRPSNELGDRGRLFLGQWLNMVHSGNLNRNDTEIAQQVLVDLGQMAYSGVNRFLWTTHGIFFPQTEIAQDGSIEILVAAEVRWVFGAPGLVRVTHREGIEFVPGVFVGEVLHDVAIDILITRTVLGNEH